VISIGESIPYSNQTLWLRMDLPQLRETTPQSIAETSWVIRKRLGEPGLLLPPHNRYWRRIGDERSAVFEENFEWLQANPEIFQEIITYYREYRYPFIPNLDADASLYQIGFYSKADEKLCRQFQLASLVEKAMLIEQFASQDARTLAWRILGRNYPHALPAEYENEFKTYLQCINPFRQEDAPIDYREERRTTPRAALIEIKRLQQTGEFDKEQHRLLADLENYIRSNFTLNTDQHGQTQIGRQRASAPRSGRA
jgi:exodeoxyribonuclease-1